MSGLKKYMVVYHSDDAKTCAAFFDTWKGAEDFRMNCECGMGWYAEVYERKMVEQSEEYVLIA